MLRNLTSTLITILCVLLMMGWAQARPPAMRESPPVLAHVKTFNGARLLLDTEPGKISHGAWTRLIFPVAVAASPFDMYIADVGSRHLYRYHPALDGMSIVPEVSVTPQTRLALGMDGSIYVSSATEPLRHFVREGAHLFEIPRQPGGIVFDDIALDRTSGMIYGLNRTFGRIEEIYPTGQASAPLFNDLRLESPNAIALDGFRLYYANLRCNCIIATDLPQRTRTIIAKDFVSPTMLAAQDGWLVALDSITRKISVFYRDQPLGSFKFEALQLTNPRGITLNNGLLYVADAGGNKIEIFRLNK